MFGNYVTRNPVRPSHSIKVKMVHLPTPEVQQQAIPDEPVVQPEPQEEIKADLPPKELPKPKPVGDFLRTQGRFKGLSPEAESAIQEQVDRKWATLEKRAA